MISAAVFLLAVQAPSPGLALLDSWTEIKAALPAPVSAQDLERPFQLLRNGQVIAEVKGAPHGDPIRPRRLPQTPGRVILAGSFQEALGGKAWDPDGDVTQMVEEAPGIFTLAVQLPAGRHEFKVARGGNWGENYGAGFTKDGANISLTVPSGGRLVAFRVDFNARQILNSLENSDRVPAPSAPTHAPAPPGEARYPGALLRLPRPLSPEDVRASLTLKLDEGRAMTVYARDVLKDQAFVFEDQPLGAFHSPSGTTFRTWSPPATQVDLLLFRTPSDGSPRRVPLQPGPKGSWSAAVPGDLHGVYYQYDFTSYGVKRRAADIHGFAASADSQFSMVVDLSQTNPSTWPAPVPNRHRTPTDAVVYALHVRDFTVHPASGVPAPERGKYLGMVRRGLKTPSRTLPAGLDYLADLGVTDVHLQPLQDFHTGNPDEYNWGYVTTLFNVPESQYAVKKGDPAAVIREFKTMVEGLHRAGLRVVMDVVYNHTWPPEGPGSAFEQTVPFYFFRTNDQGFLLNESGVGNAMADERPMVRRYIRDSLLYWMKEYRVDGFRFDLLGMHTPDSVRDWVTAMRQVRPDATLYGEPWTGGGPTRFGKGAQAGVGIAVFNDRFRGVFRGDLDGSRPGFIAGGGADPAALQSVLSGSVARPGDSVGFTKSPSETINYVSAHDNMTLGDRLDLSMSGKTDLKPNAVRLAAASVLLSLGIPFWEGGAELGRTKGGSHNSYNLGDAVNQYDWLKAEKHRETRDWLKGLIALRKGHSQFRSPSTTLAMASLSNLPQGAFAYTLNQPGRPLTLVILNGSTRPIKPLLPPGRWDLLADGRRASPLKLRSLSTSLTLEPLSAAVLIQPKAGVPSRRTARP